MCPRRHQISSHQASFKPLSSLFQANSSSYKMSFQITDASAPGAMKIQFSCRHYHSKVQEDQLALVRQHKIILGPWVSDAGSASVFATQPKEEALNYMGGRVPSGREVKQIRTFLEMPVGSVGFVISKESGTYQTLVVRITSDYAAGPAPGLRALRNAEGTHSRIALEEKLPAGELFHCLYRQVDVLGELADSTVRAWAVTQIAKLKPEESAAALKGDNLYALRRIGAAKSFDTLLPLWLSAAAAAAEPAPNPEVAVPAPAPVPAPAAAAAPLSLPARILRLENAVLGSIYTDALLLRVRRLEVTLADLHADGFDIAARVKNLETLAGI